LEEQTGSSAIGISNSRQSQFSYELSFSFLSALKSNSGHWLQYKTKNNPMEALFYYTGRSTPYLNIKIHIYHGNINALSMIEATKAMIY
jgi:hypothetical protein